MGATPIAPVTALPARRFSRSVIEHAAQGWKKVFKDGGKYGGEGGLGSKLFLRSPVHSVIDEP